MVQHTCSCKKARLAYPTAAASAPQPRLSSAPHITQPHSCTARVLQPHADSAAHIHAKKGIFHAFAVNREGNSPPGIHSPAAPWWYTRQHTITRRAVLVVACRALAQDQPRRFHWFAVMRGWVRLGELVAKCKRSQVCSTRSGCEARRPGSWAQRSVEALDVTSLANHGLLRGRPGGWKHLAALPCPAQLAMAGGCCIVTGEAG